MTRVTDVFVDAGMLAHDTGQLPAALEELAIRLDLAGAGELLTAITDRTCWGVGDQCPHCGTDMKAPPNPHPKPPDPKPPADPKPGQ